MARKTITGLYAHDGIWRINKVVRGHRIHESTGTSSRPEAEKYLIHRLEQLRQELIYGVRVTHTFKQAATRYVKEFSDQRSIGLTRTYLDQLEPFIGHLPLTHVDDESLAPFIKWMKKPGVFTNGKPKRASSGRTINLALQRCMRVLSLSHRKWRDAQKRPWLDAVPSITLVDESKTRRAPYPLSWDEQRVLFAELPDHLRVMALFKVNTGLREQEVCKLSWEWEVAVPELDTTVFIIPPDFGGRSAEAGVKNGDERVVILNDVARSIIDAQRLLRDQTTGRAKSIVFPYRGRAIHRMNDTAWRSARIRASDRFSEEYRSKIHPGFLAVRVHDLKHSFGRRLKAANINFEDRQALLGHKCASVTTHYSGSELAQLIASANKIASSGAQGQGPTLTILRRHAA